MQIELPPSRESTSEKPINGFSTGALVCSIGAVITSFMHPPMTVALTPLAIVLGAVGLTKEDGRGMAAAGLAIGVLNLLGWILVIALGAKILSFAGR